MQEKSCVGSEGRRGVKPLTNRVAREKINHLFLTDWLEKNKREKEARSTHNGSCGDRQNQITGRRRG